MAVTAKFQADFSSFLQAVDKAELALVDFGKGASQVEGKLNRMVDNFSGRKLIQEAQLMTIAVEKAGGVSVLTAKELERVGHQAQEAAEKMRKLGYEVPAGLQKIADTTKGAGTEWDKFVKGFNVEQAIANPLATGKQAVLAFTETLGATAIAAAAFVTAIVAVGIAIFKLAKDAAEVGGNLDDMADKTGMSVPALSRLSNAADVAGTTLSAMTDVVFNLERRMGEGGDAFEAGLKKMSLSTEQLKSAGPDRYLELVIDGLNGIADPSERAAVGNAVLGKSYRDVAANLKDLADGFRLTNDIEPWTAEQAQQAEHFDMQIASIVVHAKALGLAFGRDAIPFVAGFVSAIEKVTAVLVPLVGRLSGISGMLEKLAFVWTTAAAAIDVFRGAANKIPPITGEAKAGVEKWQKSVTDLALKVPTLTAALITEEFATKSLTARQAELTKAHGAAAAAVKKLAADQIQALNDTIQRMQDFHKEGEEGAAAVIKGLQGMSFVLRDLAVQMDDLQLAASKSFAGMGALMPDLSRHATQHMFELRDGTTAWDKSIHDLARSFEMLANISGESFGGIVKELATVTAALALADRAIEDLREGGGLVNFSIASVAAMDAATKSANRTTATLGGLATGAKLGMQIAGPYGAAVGAVAGALIGWARSAGAAERAINPLREQFVQMAGGLHELNVRAQAAGVSLTAMLNAKNPEQYKKAIDELNQALQIQDDAMKTLDETVARYGFTLEELGPKFRQGKLDEQFVQLFKDQKILTAGGVEFDKILEKQAKSFQELIATAVKTGATIPAEMKPAIARMIELGLLTDESGEKLTSLEGLTFAETLDAKFSTLIDTISKLADAITRSLGGAIAAIPRQVTIDVGYNYQPYNPPSQDSNYASRGGLVTATGIQYLGMGGNVLPFMPRGTDTVPAMLTPGERVLSVKETRAYNAGAGGRRVDFDTKRLERKLDQLGAQLANEQRRAPERTAIAIRDALNQQGRRRA